MKMTLSKRVIVPVLAATFLLVGSGFKSDFFEIAKQIEIFTTLFKELNMNYVDDTNPAELMDTAIKEMLDDLDPYTRYMNEQDVEEYKIRNAGEYSGIGASVRRYKDRLVIVEPYKDYPADKAGLKAGDEIIKIGDIVVEDFKDDTSELLKGAVGSTVKITYKRQGKTRETSLVRDEIEVDAVPFYGKIDDKTGYIALVKFNSKASKQTKEALEDLKSQGVERLVLDLRSNPGGLLNESINIVNLFVPKGEVIVTTKSKVKKFNRVYKTKKDPIDTKIPLVVLVNGSSASASEIVSGALQDLDRAVIMGARSFGKGLVQRPKKLTYGTQLKVTISRYYTPSGRCIQALDYWNRDQKGKAIRTSEKDYNEFKTRRGRRVYDGGGIMPDVEVANLKHGSLTKALIANNVIFDFATDFYYDKPFDDVDSFKFTDKDFERFKEFVKNHEFDYETKTEKMIKEAMENEEVEELGPKIKAEFNELLANVDQAKLASLDSYKDEIMVELKNQLLRHYFYREGLFKYNLTNDEAVTNATKILANPKQYNGILK
ncbi:S41 family peptidase [Sungkyunkwania multivorans]|uniref:S41 family peptidase n=1 Tax=Sungkyunkwania multivorans TaxID=1173618 RepID=A0ABW3CZD4_9FLAO